VQFLADPGVTTVAALAVARDVAGLAGITRTANGAPAIDVAFVGILEAVLADLVNQARWAVFSPQSTPFSVSSMTPLAQCSPRQTATRATAVGAIGVCETDLANHAFRTVVAAAVDIRLRPVETPIAAQTRTRAVEVVVGRTAADQQNKQDRHSATSASWPASLAFTMRHSSEGLVGQPPARSLRVDRPSGGPLPVCLSSNTRERRPAVQPEGALRQLAKQEQVLENRMVLTGRSDDVRPPHRTLLPPDPPILALQPQAPMAKKSAGLMMYRRMRVLWRSCSSIPAARSGGAGTWEHGGSRKGRQGRMSRSSRRPSGSSTRRRPSCRKARTGGLGWVRLSGGKRVHAWAFEATVTRHPSKQHFEAEWPPRSGRRETFPEVDKAAFFGVDAARRRMHPAQVPLLDRLTKSVVV